MAHIHDVVVALVEHAEDIPTTHAQLATNLERQWQRRDMDRDQWHDVAMDVLHDHLAADIEDPATDPELGDPLG